MRILCTGISHKTAGVALRERASIDRASLPRALADLRARWDEGEFAVLSTCNRTEVYCARPVHGHPREHELHHWLTRTSGAPDGAGSAGDLAAALYTLADGEAVRHLLAVAAGLDSLVVGEAQIASQVKAAHAAAVEAGTSGPALNMLFQAALGAARTVRGETGIGSSPRSVASLAIECACRRLGGVDARSVLTVGAGKMNQLMIRRLRELGAGRVTVVNRSRERAERLAEAFDAQWADFSLLPELLVRADVVLSSTASDSPIITRAMLAAAAGGRDSSRGPLLVIDIAVPRDVAPDARDVPGATVYDIDDLERLVASDAAPEPDAHARAQALISAAADDVLRELRVREVAPTIAAMYRFMRRIADSELADATNKLDTHDDAEADRKVLDRALRRTVRRILHPAVTALRQSSADGAAAAHVAALRRLFDLDDQDEDKADAKEQRGTKGHAQQPVE